MPDRADQFDAAVLDRIARLELRARQVVEGFISGMHESPFKGFSIEFADRREYAPGDDPRHIDWRVHAKTDRLYVKEYEVETNVRAHLLLDCSGSMAYPEEDRVGRLSKWEYAATAALALAHLLVVRQSDAAGLVLFDGALRGQTAVSANIAALPALAELVGQHAPAGLSGVKLPFTELAQAVPRRGTVIVLSDLLTDVDDVIQGLEQLRAAHHEVIVLHVLDPDELELPFADRTLFEDMEAAGSELLADPQSLRTTYREAVGRFIERIQSACLQRRIGYTLFNTADSVERSLVSFLTNRMHTMRTRR